MLRIPNLLIIVLTFYIVRHLVFLKVYSQYSITPGMPANQYSLLVFITILIAAAGYISNDYFDVATDRINKPHKQYIGKQITPGSALAIAIIISLTATALTTWLTITMKSWVPVTLLMTALVVAWWYAVALKTSFLLGNIAVSCMSAGTIAMAWLVEKQGSTLPQEGVEKITAIVTAVCVFAFLLSLLREIVKDVEDIEGDSAIHCKSLPLRKGLRFTKKVLFSITAITLLLLILTQVRLHQVHKPVVIFWLLIAVELPVLYFLLKLRKASAKSDFHNLSSLLKWIMVGGIGSIVAGQI